MEGFEFRSVSSVRDVGLLEKAVALTIYFSRASVYDTKEPSKA